MCMRLFSWLSEIHEHFLSNAVQQSTTGVSSSLGAGRAMSMWSPPGWAGKGLAASAGPTAPGRSMAGWRAASALSTGHLPRDGDGPWSGRVVSLQVGVKIRPDEGNWGETQNRDGPAGPWGRGWDEIGPGVRMGVWVPVRPGHSCSQFRLRPCLTASA